MTAQRGKPLSRRAGRREQRDRFLIYAEDALVTRYDDTVPLRDRNPWASVQGLFRELQNTSHA